MAYKNRFDKMAKNGAKTAYICPKAASSLLVNHSQIDSMMTVVEIVSRFSHHTTFGIYALNRCSSLWVFAPVGFSYLGLQAH